MLVSNLHILSNADLYLCW